MPRIPDHIVDQVRDAADVVEVVGRRVKLVQAGRSHKGVCPFHGDKDPSLVVNRERGTWHCFGCQAGGNVFSFVMQDEGLGFPEAVKVLAARYGIALPEKPMSPQEEKAREQRRRLRQVLDLAQRFFGQQLQAPAGRPALDYLRQKRGLSVQTLELYGLGWAPAGWDGLAKWLAGQGVAEAEMLQAGLVAERQQRGGVYDRFRERVTMPIRDLKGRPISFGGRIMATGEPKYLNGPESPLFQKSKHLYNLDRARPAMRQKGRVLVVEGYFDVISLAQAGIEEAVAPMGTALTPEQVALVKRQTSEVHLVFDGDEAGRRAARRALPLFLAEDLTPRVLLLPGGEDPDSLVRERGPEALEEMLAAARPLVEWALDQEIEAAGPTTPEGKSQAVAACGPILAALGDPVARWEYLGQVAQRLSLPAELVAARLGLPVPGGRPPRPVTPPPVAPPAQTGRGTRTPSWYAPALEMALCSPPAAQVLLEEGVLALIQEGEMGQLARALEDTLATGDDAPLSAVIQRLEDPVLHGLACRLADHGPDLEPDAARREAAALATQVARWQQRHRGRAMARDIAQAEANGDGSTVARLQFQRKDLIHPPEPPAQSGKDRSA